MLLVYDLRSGELRGVDVTSVAKGIRKFSGITYAAEFGQVLCAPKFSGKLLTFGVCVLHMDAKASETSLYAGVGLKYLSDTFLRDAAEASGKDDPNFTELKEPFWLASNSRHSKGRSTICPRDGRLGSALVDALAKSNASKATAFVSWCWGYNVRMLVAALGNWQQYQSKTKRDAYFWICFFCNNQFRILRDKQQSPTSELESKFRTAVTKIGTVIAVLDTWEDPSYLKRIWTVYEQYLASTMDNVSMVMVMPPNQEQQLQHTTLAQVRQALSNVDAENAEAYSKADEDAIKDMIRSSAGGFDRVNREVAVAMSRMVALPFKRLLSEIYGGA